MKTTDSIRQPGGVGSPFEDPGVPFFLPDIGDREIDAVTDVLRSGWLTAGPVGQEFERRFAEYVGAAHAVAVNSGSAALHLAVAAADIGPNDEVIVPTVTFAATAEAVLHVGARPVLVDCDPTTLNVDVAAIEAAISPRTRAVMPVHYAGQPCDMDEIMAVALRHDLVVIEDAAHALPASYHGRRIGSIADATCFSFYASKTITSGEGGMVTTDDPELAARIRRLSHHGITKSSWERYGPSASWDYRVVERGFKYNLSDIAAALGLAQLERADEFHTSRAARVATYMELLDGDLSFRPLRVAPDRDHAWHLFVGRLDLDRLRISRADYVEQLHRRGIGASVHFRPLHLHPLFSDSPPAVDLPAATEVFEEIVSLPLYTQLTRRQIETIVRAMTEIENGNLL